ncbi:MAG: universal stress protein [Gordonia sp. (in: high G+C Gram-positive bacteria)]
MIAAGRRIVPAEIVVGVDGSKASTRALDWAARTAVREYHRLTVLGVVDLLGSTYAPELAIPSSVVDAISAEITGTVHSAVAAARAAHPGLEVEGRVAAGSAPAALTEAAAQASLTVVGTRHLSGVKGLFLGSVSSNVAAHAPSPVAVIAGPAGSGPVVVGIDGSELTERVLAAAYRTAAQQDVGLVLVHSWTDLASGALHGYGADAESLFTAVENAHRLITGWIDRFSVAYPSVRVERVVAADGPARRILAAAADAALIVVGSRGRGGFAGLLLGSTSQTILHHATCPVLVIKAGTTAHASV